MNQPRYIVGGSGQGQVASSGGGAPEWSAGTYLAGSLVTRGPWLWRANNTTSEDPLVVEGNLGSGADWVVQTTGSSGMVQSGTELLLINNFGGQATTAYRQNTHSGFLGKMIMVEVQMSGAADWLHFGIFNSAAVQTATNINAAASTFYGVNINLFNQRVENWIDGVVGTNFSYTNALITNAATQYSRWYLSMIQNGANWDLTLYRDARSTTAGTDPEAVEDLVALGSFTNVSRPAYTDWRFVVGARTGGSSGFFRCRAAYVRNLTSGNWRAVSRLPSQLG